MKSFNSFKLGLVSVVAVVGIIIMTILSAYNSDGYYGFAARGKGSIGLTPGLSFEAESGNSQGFLIGQDPRASNKQYIYSPDGIGTASYSFKVDKSGLYKISTKTATTSPLSKYFYVQLNNDEKILVNAIESNNYKWNDVSNNGKTQWLLNPGDNTIKIEAVDPEVKIDAITLSLITADCADNDGDGYGKPSSELCLHQQEDCNDLNKNINPGVEEICENSIDDNCDGQIDEGCPESCIDNDGDGYFYGQSCSNGPDCDDNDANIYPGATEICGNYIDEDCNGSDLTCVSGFPIDTVVQAESGSNNGFTIASGYVYSTIGNSNSISYTFDVPQAGQYVIDTGIVNPDFGTNSFYVGLNGETAANTSSKTYDTLTGTGVVVDTLRLRGNSPNDTYAQFDPMIYILNAGQHTFTFYGREQNTRMDYLKLRSYNGTNITVECQSGQTQSCNTGLLGICAVGTQTCSNNQWGSCVAPSPQVEICGNGIDEDCNGIAETCSNNPPIVSISSPVTGSTFNISSNITIVALASDPNGSISKVEFYRNNALISTDMSFPYSYLWTNALAGTYNIYARAYDNLNATTNSTPIIVNVANPQNITNSTGGAWYVDGAVAVSGNGQSWSSAWKSFSNIQWASIQPGDTIYISGGTTSKIYTSTLSVDASGTPGNRITITKGVDSGHDGEVVISNVPGSVSGYGVTVVNEKHIVVKNLKIINRNTGVYIQGMSPGALKDVIVENMFINHTDQAGIFITGHSNTAQVHDYVQDVVLRNNYITAAGTDIPAQTDGIYMQYWQDVTIEGNFFNMINRGASSCGSDPHIDAIQANRGKNLTIRNNYIRYNVDRNNDLCSSQIFMNAWNIGVTDVYGNIIESWVPGSGEGMVGAVGSYKPGSLPPFDGPETVNFYNNVVIGDNYRTISLSTEGVPGSSFSVKNNIFVNMRDSSHNLFSAFPANVEFATPPTDWGLINGNVYYNWFGATDKVLAHAPFVGSGGRSPVSVSQLRGMGAESSGMYANPLFTDFNNRVYTLAANSPAIDAGLDLGVKYNIAYNGVSRPQGAGWDIGAYEFVSGVACQSGQTQSCNTGLLGICAVGTQTCSNGQWGSCVAPSPQVEICGNGIDEDCNGSDLSCNIPPSVFAGTDKTLVLPNNLSLSGNVSDDGLPNPPGLTTVKWTKQSGPGTVIFGNANVLSTTASFSTNGTYVLRLAANDSALTSYDELIVTVLPQAVNVPPTIYIVSPISGTNYAYPSYVSINVTASDSDGTISRVEFYADGVLLATDTSSPYYYTWMNATPGNYSLRARAYDNLNASTNSSIVPISVVAPVETCGNGVCAATESCTTCSQDCGVCNPSPITGAIIVDHTSINDFSTIPECWIDKAKQDLHIAFSHTSHGSQIPSGMKAMRDYNSVYAFSATGGPNVLHFEDYPGRNTEYDGFGTGLCYDLGVCDDGGEGILAPTRTFLNSPEGQDINVIMWSWSSILYHDVPFYLDKMKILIAEYENGNPQHPLPVKFVFITGHMDFQGPGDGTNFADYQNRQIRNFIYDNSPNAFCKQHQCIFYDYGDMEEYDPDGNYFLDNAVGDNLDYFNPNGNWGADYLTRYPAGMDADLTNIISTNYECAHSDTQYGAYVNCALKAKAAWYMYARMAGWDGVSQTCDITNITSNRSLLFSQAKALTWPPPITNTEFAGAESNPTGNPIGGYYGYDRIVNPEDADYIVHNASEFIYLFSYTPETYTTPLLPGQVVYIDDNAIIDLPGKYNFHIPANVTIASGRGRGFSKGALIRNLHQPFTPEPSFYFMMTDGPGVRVTGIRFEGPDKSTQWVRQMAIAGYDTNRTNATLGGDLVLDNYYDMGTTAALLSRYARIEVDNCEFSGWTMALAIGEATTDFGGPTPVHGWGGSEDAWIHHNYIHHNPHKGLGYGIVLGTSERPNEYNVTVLVEGNIFDFNRHAVASPSARYNSYEARYNLIMPENLAIAFDRHGGGGLAGTHTIVHHNTDRLIGTRASIGIGNPGYPPGVSMAYNNWVYSINNETIGNSNYPGQILIFDNYLSYYPSPGLVLPEPKLSVDKDVVKVNDVITFSASQSTGGTYGLSYVCWDFGDQTGEICDFANVAKTRSYSQPGRYLVTLKAVDVKGTPITTTKSIIVNPVNPDAVVLSFWIRDSFNQYTTNDSSGYFSKSVLVDNVSVWSRDVNSDGWGWEHIVVDITPYVKNTSVIDFQIRSLQNYQRQAYPAYHPFEFFEVYIDDIYISNRDYSMINFGDWEVDSLEESRYSRLLDGQVGGLSVGHFYNVGGEPWWEGQVMYDDKNSGGYSFVINSGYRENSVAGSARGIRQTVYAPKVAPYADIVDTSGSFRDVSSYLLPVTFSGTMDNVNNEIVDFTGYSKRFNGQNNYISVNNFDLSRDWALDMNVFIPYVNSQQTLMYATNGAGYVHIYYSPTNNVVIKGNSFESSCALPGLTHTGFNKIIIGKSCVGSTCTLSCASNGLINQFASPPSSITLSGTSAVSFGGYAGSTTNLFGAINRVRVLKGSIPSGMFLNESRSLLQGAWYFRDGTNGIFRDGSLYGKNVSVPSQLTFGSDGERRFARFTRNGPAITIPRDPNFKVGDKWSLEFTGRFSDFDTYVIHPGVLPIWMRTFKDVVSPIGIFDNKFLLYFKIFSDNSVGDSDQPGYYGVRNTKMLRINEWYTIVFTKDGDYLNAYVNGVLDRKMYVPGVNSVYDNSVINDLIFGYISGDISRLSIYDKTLTPIEAKALYESSSLSCSDSDNDGYGIFPRSGVVNGCRLNGFDCNDANAGIGASGC